MSEQEFMRFIYNFGLVPSRDNFLSLSLRFLNYESFFPFISSMFLHGSWFHLISNMWILWLFGDNIEDSMGHFKYILYYVICGVIASFTHLMFNQMSNIPAVGASGAIAGIMGAYMLLFPYSKIVTLIPIFVIVPLFVNIPAILFLALWFLSQLYSGTIELISGGTIGGVGWWAHIGGFVVGMFIYKFFINKKAAYRY